MTLYQQMFRWDLLEESLDGRALLRKMLEVEAALALSQGSLGLIPKPQAQSIVDCCKMIPLDIAGLEQSAAKAGNLAIPLVKQLTEAVRRKDPAAAAYVHRGATSQDILDTAAVLQFRDATSLITDELGRLCAALEKLTEQHRGSVMAGRTWLQHAVPVTFGLKTAHMLDAISRHRNQIVERRESISILQFGGAAGTLAAFSQSGLQLEEELAKRLGLQVPTLPWHTDRGNIASIATTVGLIAGTLGKIARDISLLSQTEVAEVSEGYEAGRGGSSSMPHKRNPVASAVVLSISIRVPGLVSSALSSMIQEHERALGGWHAEWEVIPELLSLVGGAVHCSANMMERLKVDVEQMRENLELSNGEIFSEGVTLSLANRLGRAEADAIIERTIFRAREQKIHLRDALVAETAVKENFTDTEVAALFEPSGYLGSTNTLIDRTLARYHHSLKQGHAIR